MNAQKLNLKLIRGSSFNGFDGEKVAADLKANPQIWRGAVMTRLYDLIFLRDLPGCWNVDTLFITPVKGSESALWDLAKAWNADDMDWLGGEEACHLLGSYSSEKKADGKQILRLWWD